ncbi:MAG: hypothetical protein KF858_01465 [Candidatus Sumerlaeia bacterium]|nr:hypothetical protein [Candidatus Sumerlaeia bacterium]
MSGKSVFQGLVVVVAWGAAGILTSIVLAAVALIFGGAIYYVVMGVVGLLALSSAFTSMREKSPKRSLARWAFALGFCLRTATGFLYATHLMANVHLLARHWQSESVLWPILVVETIACEGAAYRAHRHVSLMTPDVIAVGATDPFTNQPLRASNSGFHYSIGPDLIDQGAVLLYDPSNGTLSTGDIIAGWDRLTQPTRIVDPHFMPPPRQ